MVWMVPPVIQKKSNTEKIEENTADIREEIRKIIANKKHFYQLLKQKFDNNNRRQPGYIV